MPAAASFWPVPPPAGTSNTVITAHRLPTGARLECTKNDRQARGRAHLCAHLFLFALEPVLLLFALLQDLHFLFLLPISARKQAVSALSRRFLLDANHAREASNDTSERRTR